MIVIMWILVAITSVQVGASFAKSLFPLIGALPTAMLRISFGAIILFFIFRPWKAKLTKQNLRPLLVYGTCLGLMNCTFYLAFTRIPLGICVALEFIGPLAVALFSSKRKIDFLWAFLAVTGIILLLPRGSSASSPTSLDPFGVVMALTAGLCWAFYILSGKRIGTLFHEGHAASLGMIVASAVSLPFGLSQFHAAQFTSAVLWQALGVALLSSAIPYTIEMFAMKKIPVKTFGILMSLEPAVAALSGLVILGERLRILQWLAILCVVAASLGSTLTSAREPIKDADEALGAE